VIRVYDQTGNVINARSTLATLKSREVPTFLPRAGRSIHCKQGRLIAPKRLPLQLLLAVLAVGTAFSLDITTRDGKTYKHAKVTGVYLDGLSITHSTGVIKVPFDNLPDTIQKEYNYNPAQVAASRKAADEAAKAAAAQAAAAQRERAQIALRAQQESRRQADQRRQQETRLVAVAEHGNDSTMILVIAIILIAVFVGVIIAVMAVIRAKQQREQRALLFKQARDFAATVQQNRALPIVPTNIILKPGESAFYSTPSALYETRAVRQYQAGHTGFRVAKGVYVGGTSGRSISTQQWAKLDTGWLTITNKRLVFVGGKEDRTIPLNKVVSVDSIPTGIVVSIEGRQKAMALEVTNSLIATLIIRLCSQVSDPLNLSGDNINIDFKE
jgi:hypothetical protein